MSKYQLKTDRVSRAGQYSVWQVWEGREFMCAFYGPWSMTAAGRFIDSLNEIDSEGRSFQDWMNDYVERER